MGDDTGAIVQSCASEAILGRAIYMMTMNAYPVADTPRRAVIFFAI